MKVEVLFMNLYLRQAVVTEKPIRLILFYNFYLYDNILPLNSTTYS